MNGMIPKSYDQIYAKTTTPQEMRNKLRVKHKHRTGSTSIATELHTNSQTNTPPFQHRAHPKIHSASPLRNRQQSSQLW